jgi:hypothetical protein
MDRTVFIFACFHVVFFSAESHARSRNLSSLAINLNERANCHPELGCSGNAKSNSRFRLSTAAESFNESFMRVRSSLRPNYTSGANRPVRVIFDIANGLGLALPIFDTSIVFIENRFKFLNVDNGDSQCITFKMRY